MCVCAFSCVQLFVTPWTSAYQVPPSMGFSRQEYWSGVPLPSPILPEQLESPAGFPSSDKTRPDSPVPTLQGQCGRSPKRRGSLRFLPPLEVRPSSVAPDPAVEMNSLLLKFICKHCPPIFRAVFCFHLGFPLPAKASDDNEVPFVEFCFVFHYSKSGSRKNLP